MGKHFWIAVLAYLLPTFPLGYFWHLVTFADQYRQLAIYREEVIIPFGLASMAIQAVAFAWAYPRLFGASSSWPRGALGFGLLFGTLSWSFAVLPVAAKYRMASITDFVALETAFTFLQFVVVSPLIALAYRPVRQQPASVA
jgi:riboflavin transporter FmnP